MTMPPFPESMLRDLTALAHHAASLRARSQGFAFQEWEIVPRVTRDAHVEAARACIEGQDAAAVYAAWYARFRAGAFLSDEIPDELRGAALDPAYDRLPAIKHDLDRLRRTILTAMVEALREAPPPGPPLGDVDSWCVICEARTRHEARGRQLQCARCRAFKMPGS